MGCIHMYKVHITSTLLRPKNKWKYAEFGWKYSG